MSDPIRPLSCLQSPVFLINSCHSLFTAAHLRGRALSRSYGTNLPSSFIRVVSNALGYSPRPPVSVWGTDHDYLKLRGFSWKLSIRCSGSIEPRHHASALTISRICLRDLPKRLNFHPTGSHPNFLRHPIAAIVSTGILTRFPSTTPLGLALGADSPCAD